MPEARNRICAIKIQREHLRKRSHAEAEENLVIAEILEGNHFELVGRDSGPYQVILCIQGSRFAIHVADMNGAPIISHILSFGPFKRVVSNYVMICNAHGHATTHADPYRLQALDMTRRAIHNEASELLRERLSSKVELDLDTARGLFTLIVAQHLVPGGIEETCHAPQHKGTLNHSASDERNAVCGR